MELSLFDYHLPKELIAQELLKNRDACRLLVLYKDTKKIEHKYFKDIINYVSTGDTMVLNKSKVIKARLSGKKATGGKVEILVLDKIGENVYSALIKPSSRIREGTKIFFADDFSAEVIEKKYNNLSRLRFYYSGNFYNVLEKYGTLPIPPYIKKELSDKNLYQTVFAQVLGSCAAPTAGLHFTEDLICKLRKKNVQIAYLTLHISIDTFRPIKEENILNHKMYSEYFEVDEKNAKIINETINKNKKIIAVGTTVVRTLEASAKEKDDKYYVEARSDRTNLYIYPGYKFKIVNSLITNFHTPRSTLLVLVSAFSSREKILQAYQEAINKKYRFLSFGDAMMIV